jgi:hypothetical protein
MKFETRPVVIDAFQWEGTASSFKNILGMGLKDWKPGELGTDTFYLVGANMEEYIVKKGDWIIKDASGNFSSCLNEEFIETYTRVFNLY